MRKTTLVQLHDNDIENAQIVLTGEANSQGEIAVATAPDEFSGCCKLRVLIPQGVIPVVHKWGQQEQDQTLPGPHWCWPFYRHIAFLVTTRSIQYNFPIKKVPTKDNVRVDVDVDIRFNIGPSLQDTSKFVYTLGISRFDDMLNAIVEEQVRSLVLGVNFEDALNQRAFWGNGIKESLIQRFRSYGVNFTICTITDLKLPQQTSENLRKIGEVSTNIFNENQRFETEKNSVLNKEKEFNLQQQRAHQSQFNQIDAEVQNKMQQQEHLLSMAQTEFEVAKRQAYEKAEQIIGEARNQKERAETNTKKQVNQLKLKAEADANQVLIKAKEKSSVDIQLATAQLEDARNRANAKLEEGKAEGLAAESLKIKREYEIKMQRAEAFKNLAHNGKFIMSGSGGKKLLDQILGKTQMK